MAEMTNKTRYTREEIEEHIALAFDRAPRVNQSVSIIRQLLSDLDKIEQLWQEYYGFLHDNDMRFDFEDKMDAAFGITRGDDE